MHSFRSPTHPLPGRAGRHSYRLGAVACAAALLAACGGGGSGGASGFKADIRRTAHGIPHIEAANEKGIGYGVGYAYAQDNFCMLAEHFTTVRGERARHFGEGAAPESEVGGLPQNLTSDFFYRLHNEDARVRAAWNGYSPAAQDLFKGFAAGYNRYLRETVAAQLPADCRSQPWARAIDELDLVRLMRDYAALNGMGDLAPALVAAQPPSAAKGLAAGSWRTALRGAPRTGSNGIALGSEATDNGRGMVLGNPHFPWFGALRMYQLHLRIPGRMDVMGATLPGLPMVGIGFTQDFAWTHTTNTAARLTFYQLRLDPQDATRYLVDGQSKPMERKTLRVEVRRADGRLETVARDRPVRHGVRPRAGLPRTGLGRAQRLCRARHELRQPPPGGPVAGHEPGWLAGGDEGGGAAHRGQPLEQHHRGRRPGPHRVHERHARAPPVAGPDGRLPA